MPVSTVQHKFSTASGNIVFQIVWWSPITPWCGNRQLLGSLMVCCWFQLFSLCWRWSPLGLMEGCIQQNLLSPILWGCFVLLFFPPFTGIVLNQSVGKVELAGITIHFPSIYILLVTMLDPSVRVMMYNAGSYAVEYLFLFFSLTAHDL